VDGGILNALLPFTVTKHVTSEEMSITVESRNGKFVSPKFYDPLIADGTEQRPELP
jgi:hypothetical protein